MFYRVLLNLVKLKVLNFLLLVFMIFSFVGLGVSSVYAYKGFQLKNKYEALDHYLLLSPFEINGDNFYDDPDDMTQRSERVLKNYLKYRHDQRVIDSSLELHTDITISEFEESIDDDFFYEDSNEDYVYPEVVFGDGEETEMMKAIKNYNPTKVYITQNIMDYYQVGIGDKLTLATYAYDYDDMLEEKLTVNKLSEVEIGGLVEAEQEYLDAFQTGIVHISIELLSEIPVGEYELHYVGASLQIDEKHITDVALELKSDGNEMFVYNTDEEITKELEFYESINTFFYAMLFSSVALFIIAFASLNNNLLDRRKQELQLYNVFGNSMVSLNIQLILEKIFLLLCSLIISIPMFLYFARVSNNIVNKMVEYSMMEGSLLINIYGNSGNEESIDTIYRGFNGIDVNNVLVIIGVLLLLIVLIVSITLIQVRLLKPIIMEQRRGE